jgi:hypothetical protein
VVAGSSLVKPEPFPSKPATVPENRSPLIDITRNACRRLGRGMGWLPMGERWQRRGRSWGTLWIRELSGAGVNCLHPRVVECSGRHEFEADWLTRGENFRGCQGVGELQYRLLPANALPTGSVGPESSQREHGAGCRKERLVVLAGLRRMPGFEGRRAPVATGPHEIWPKGSAKTAFCDAELPAAHAPSRDKCAGVRVARKSSPRRLIQAGRRGLPEPAQSSRRALPGLLRVPSGRRRAAASEPSPAPPPQTVLLRLRLPPERRRA